MEITEKRNVKANKKKNGKEKQTNENENEMNCESLHNLECIQCVCASIRMNDINCVKKKKKMKKCI